MNPATRRGMTARMQDIINDIRIHEGDDTPIGWVIQGDTLRVVQPMAAWGEEESQIIDPDTILVRSWTADHDSGDLTPEGSWTLPNPIDQNLRGPTDTYADRVLGAAVFDLDKHDDRQITAQGASAGGAITLEDPISGGALPSGWRDAMREAVARATAVDPDLVRASYLQQALDAMPRPTAWALEEEGGDLHVVAWHDLDSPQGATYDFTHLQYEVEDGMPSISTISTTREPERTAPGPMDDQRMMAESAKLIHTYQQEVRYPADLGHIPEPAYSQAGILRQGEYPQILMDDGTQAPRWDRLTSRVTEAVLSGLTALPLLEEGAPTKGTAMAQQQEHDQVQQILVAISGDERLNARVEGYAEGLAAVGRANPQAKPMEARGIEEVAAAIAQAGIGEYQQGHDQPVQLTETQVGRITAGIADRIREHAQDRDWNLERPAPGQSAPDETKDAWARVNIPSQYVHPYRMNAKDGRTFDKAIISMPEGTKVNGVDVSGFALDRFMTDAMRQAKANGKQVTLSFRVDRQVDLFKGKGTDRQTIRLDGPWELVKGLKAHLAAWRDNHTARSGQEGTGGHTGVRQDTDRQGQRPDKPSTGRDMAHELATYTQNDATTRKALESVIEGAARDMASGRYDPDHTREVMQRVTDKAAELYNGLQKPLPDRTVFSREVRAAAAAEIMKDTENTIREKAKGMQTGGPAPQLPGQRQAKPAENKEPAGKTNFLAGLVHRTDAKMKEQTPHIKGHEHARGRR